MRPISLAGLLLPSLLGSCDFPSMVEHAALLESDGEAALALENACKLYEEPGLLPRIVDGGRRVGIQEDGDRRGSRVTWVRTNGRWLVLSWFGIGATSATSSEALVETGAFQLRIYRYLRERQPNLPPPESLRRFVVETGESWDQDPPWWPTEERE